MEFNPPQKLPPPMKSFSASVIAFSAIVATGFAQAPTPVGAPVTIGAVKLGKVQHSLVKTPEFQITGGQAKRYKTGEWLELEVEFETKREEVDELTFKYTVLVEKKLLDGEVTVINIPKGRDHYSVMYVAPRSLEKLTAGKPVTPAAVENVWVDVLWHGQVLDSVSVHPGKPPNLPHITGLVANKNETPFAPLYYDRYEVIKSAR